MKTVGKTFWAVLVFGALLAACGWFEPEEESQQQQQPQDYIPTYTITFDANGGIGTVPAQKAVAFGSSIILPMGDGLSKAGYTFGGWNESPEGWGTNYHAGGSYGTSYYASYDRTLYAKWNPIPVYSVYFDANGGSGAVPDRMSVTEGSSIILPDGSGLSRVGYAFGGWKVATSGAGAAYQPGDYYTPAANSAIDIILFVHWISDYTVTFDRNRGSGETPPAQSVPFHSGIALPDGTGFSRDGYLFGGWYTNVSGAITNYSAGETFTPSGNITLYARWAPDFGTGPIPLTEKIWVNDSITSSTVARGVWYSLDVISGTTYYVWKNDAGDGNGGKTLRARISAIYHNGTDIFTDVTLGWTYQPLFTAQTSGTVYVRVAPYGNYIGTFAVAYSTDSAKLVVYTVTFSASGGIGTVPEKITVQPPASMILPDGSGLTRDGYTFSGWNTELFGTGITYQSGDSYTPTADITLYARWLTNYTVTFNANGGTGAAPSPIIVPDGSGIILPDGSGLEKSDYTFAGWNTNASGTGTTYRSGDLYAPPNSITLYAAWQPNPGTGGISFDVEQIIDGLPIIADITISRTGSGYPVTQIVSVNAADYDAGSIKWEIAGVGINAGQTVTGSGAFFTLNAGEVKYNSLGAHVLTLTVTKNGQRYQRAIPFTIVR